MPGFRVGFDTNQERKSSDVVVSLIDDNRIGFDPNTTGQYFENISCIGYLHDMSIGEVLAKFAHSPVETAQIRQIYKDCEMQYTENGQTFSKDTRRSQIDFYRPLQSEQCRVIEIWTKEQFDSFYCHDTAKGEQYFVSTIEEQNIIAENNRRILEMVQAGGTAEDAALIEYEYSQRTSP